MNAFEYQCKTELVFGVKAEDKLVDKLRKHNAKRVLLVYGGNSIKNSGLYDRVTTLLKMDKIDYTELPGVVPNPRVSLVRKGIGICREEKIDFLLAVGGGSVIDTCKAISYGVFYEGDVWELVINKAKPGDTRIPVGCILTLPAAGSEASDSCVISDETVGIKGGFAASEMRPVFAIMNPELTYTLPAYQTACGCMDIMAHAMERYFSLTPDVYITDCLGETMIKAIVMNLPKVLANPCDLAARSEIMLAGTLAQNDLTGMGRQQDWFNHVLEHQISGYYDIAHGAGLAISFPAWMEYLLDKQACLPKLIQYAVNIWGVEPDENNPENTAREGIQRLSRLIADAGLPAKLSDVNIDDDKFALMADNMTAAGNAAVGSFYPMNKQDILALLQRMK